MSPAQQNVHNYDPRTDASQLQSEAANQQGITVALHPEDKILSGHWCSVMIRKPDSKLQTGMFDSNTQVKYNSEPEILDKVRSIIDNMRATNEQSLVVLRDKIEKYEKANAPSTGELKARLKKMQTENVWAYQHISTGTWASQRDFAQNILRNVTLQNTIKLKPFKTTVAVTKLNKGVQAMETRQFDNVQRTVTPYWVIVGFGEEANFDPIDEK